MTAARHLEPVGERDYLAEMRALIEAETSAGEYVSALVAQHIVNKLRATDPDLLEGWLHANAVGFIRHSINLRDCASRTSARHNAKRNTFADDAERFAKGDRGAMSDWLSVVHVVDEAGTRKRLADMVAGDLDHVATDYEHRANENRLHAAFLRALAKKVGKRTVSAVFTEEKIAALWQSIAGG